MEDLALQIGSAGIIAFVGWLCSIPWNSSGKIIEEIVEDIKEFERLGVQYWQIDGSHPDSPVKAAMIKCLSSRIGRKIAEAHRDLLLFYFYGTGNDRHLIALRQAITGGTFEQTNRIKDLSRLPIITARSDDLIRAVKSSRRMQWSD